MQPVDLVFASQSPLRAPFQSPSGRTLTVTSFSSAGRQIIRFTPTEAGLWRYSVRAGDRTIGAGRIRARESPARGFVRTSGRSLRNQDGTLFVAIGENRINIYDPTWNWRGLSMRDYVSYVAGHGVSTLRVFIVSDIEDEERHRPNLGVLEPAVGRFDDAVAAQFDSLFRAAQASDIGIVLVAFALGFSQEDPWKSWQDNPYSRERGGPAATRFDFFESDAARAAAAGRIRYLAARYAPFPSLLAIDLLNEPEWDGGIPEVSWGPWAQEMSRHWDDADPYEHPVTVGSVGLHWNIEGDERDWWSNDACHIVQWHLYGKEVYDVHALAAEMTRKVRETWSFGKPVLVGEFAYGGEAKPGYDHTHVGLWSAAFSGAGVLAHSAPAFNVDSDELMTPERARHFHVLRDTLASLPGAEPGEIEVTRGASGWVLLGERAGAIWLLGPASGYGLPFKGAQVRVQGAAEGLWRVEWLDDVSRTSLGEFQVRTIDGELEIPAPPFVRHAVAYLRRE
jgi:hypothetical protein